jgi:hypothetical protein
VPDDERVIPIKKYRRPSHKPQYTRDGWRLLIVGVDKPWRKSILGASWKSSGEK